MRKSDFFYELPPELIAQHPASKRSDSRLLEVTPEGLLVDRKFPDIVDLLRAGDLLVVNDTKVVNARLMGHKATGGRVEIMLERVSGEWELLAQVRASKSPKQGTIIYVDNAPGELHVTGRVGDFFSLRLVLTDSSLSLSEWLEQHGSLPLPPYVERQPEANDQQRYQTVYAKSSGAVAAPTAGLHYSEELLAELANKGVEIATVTLHVGAGTYQPVRSDQIEDHKMHSEWAHVDQRVCDAVNATRDRGGRVIAVGTTSMRSLESAALASTSDKLEPFSGETNLFIYPGFDFKAVDCLQTNFHLPESTLLMLVSAFVERETILRAYQHAVDQKYRFFSYGDAMFLHRKA